MKQALIILAIFLLAAAAYFRGQFIKYKDLYNKELTNVEAYANENSNLKTTNKKFQFTIDELKNSQDSLNKKLYDAVKALNIKDKNVESIQYIENTITKTDTLTIKGDTIFRDRFVNVDTVMGDEWYKLNLKLQYPSTVVATPKFKSEKYLVVNVKKEYVNKPSKIFFIRWFQKKKRVVTIDVLEKNPYITEDKYRYIEVIK